VSKYTIAEGLGTIVTKVGSTTYAIKADGTIMSSSTTAPETVIQAAFDSGDINICLPDTVYTMSAGFTGIEMTNSYRTLIMGRFTQLLVPQGFTGTCLLFDEHSFCKIYGGRLGEAGSPQKLWTGLVVKSHSSTGTKHNTFENMEISGCGVGISIQTTTTESAFVNSCHFRNIFMYYPIVGMEWVLFTGSNMSHNDYYSIDIQADDNTLYGFKNVNGRSPVFINPTCQDMDPANVQMSTASTCGDLVLVGGTINSGGTTGLFTDNGRNTMAIARGIGLHTTRTEYKTMTAPSNPPTGNLRVYAKQIDANNDGLFVKVKKAGVVTEVQIA
jgi:hypothetical protein